VTSQLARGDNVAHISLFGLMRGRFSTALG